MVELKVRYLERTKAEIAKLVSAFNDNGIALSDAKAEWQYLLNPVDRLRVMVTEAPGDPDPKVAGIYAVQPGWIKLRDRRALGFQSLDTLTDKDFRGRGIFAGSARKVFSDCRFDGGALVYGFPNANSAPGFFGKLGWTCLDPVPFLVRPLRLSYALRSHPRVRRIFGRFANWPLLVPRWRNTSSDLVFRYENHFNESHEEVWREFSATIGVAVDRTAEYLNWRIGMHPEGYTAIGAYRAGRLSGYVVFGIRRKHGGVIGYVLDLIHRKGAERDGERLLSRATKEMAERGVEVMLAWNMEHSPNHGCFRRAGFLPLPEALRPIKLHFGVLPLEGSQSSVITTRRNWYLSYCDSDTV